MERHDCNLDTGMAAAEARGLAHRIAAETGLLAEVVPDVEYFVVEVRTENGVFILYDEADWAWLRERILDVGALRLLV